MSTSLASSSSPLSSLSSLSTEVSASTEASAKTSTEASAAHASASTEASTRTLVLWPKITPFPFDQGALVQAASEQASPRIPVFMLSDGDRYIITNSPRYHPFVVLPDISHTRGEFKSVYLKKYPPHEITCVAASNCITTTDDSAYLAAGDVCGHVYVWTLSDGNIHSIYYNLHKEQVNCIAFIPGTSFLITSSESSAYQLDVTTPVLSETAKEEPSFWHHVKYLRGVNDLTHLAVSTAKTFLVGMTPYGIYNWVSRPFSFGLGPFNKFEWVEGGCMEFSKPQEMRYMAAGKKLVVCSNPNGEIVFWVDVGEMKDTTKQPHEQLVRIKRQQLCLEGRSTDGIALQTMDCVLDKKQQVQVLSVCVTPTDKVFVGLNNGEILHITIKCQILSSLKLSVSPTSISFSADERRLVAHGWNKRKVVVWTQDTKE